MDSTNLWLLDQMVDEFGIAMALLLTAFLSAASGIDYKLMPTEKECIPGSDCCPGKINLALISKPKAAGEWDAWSVNGKPLPMNGVYQLTAKWCGPCRQVKPLLVAYQKAGYPIVFVDVDNTPKLAKKLGMANTVPVTVLMIDGKVVKKHEGSISEEALKPLAKRALAASRTKARK